MKIQNMIIVLLVSALIVPTIALSQDQGSIPLKPFGAELSGEASYLENEAGISAYGQVNYVDLNLAENAFKYVEKKTADYIIGVVSLPGYDESHDVHVYLDT